jgi:hypothetical protein
MHASVVGAPGFHVLEMHGVGGIIVATRPNRVVILAWRVRDEQAFQSVSINDPPQICVKFGVRAM